jgi:hypothetical protein
MSEPALPSESHRRGCLARLLAVTVGLLVVSGLAPSTGAAATAPIVLHESASDVTQTDGRLNAAIETAGNATSYEFWLVDPCPEPLECIRVLPVGHGTVRGAKEPETVHLELASAEGAPNIEPGTTYEYWALVRNSAGTSEGAHQVFTTLPQGTLATILREAATSVTATNATLQANIAPGWQTTEYQLWISDPCPPPLECIRDVMAAHGTIHAGVRSRSVHVELATAEGAPNIEPVTSYEYWATARNASGIVEGPRHLFTTQP